MRKVGQAWSAKTINLSITLGGASSACSTPVAFHSTFFPGLIVNNMCEFFHLVRGEKFISITRTNQTQSSSWSSSSSSSRGVMWIPFVGEILEDALTAHLPRVPPVLLPWIISSIKSSPFWSVYFVLYFYCTRICMQRKNVETLKMYREILSGAAESETHDPKSSKRRTQNPPKKKEKEKKYTKIEMHKKILNSIRYVSVVLHGDECFSFHWIVWEIKFTLRIWNTYIYLKRSQLLEELESSNLRWSLLYMLRNWSLF